MKAARYVAVLFLGVVVASALAPQVWTSSGYEVQFRDAPDAPPSSRFPLGTDALGRDRLARLLYGSRVSLLLAPAAALLSCLAAALFGGVAGMAGSRLDRLMQGTSDLFLSLPWLFLLLAVRASLPLNVGPAASVTITFLMLGLLGWPGPARVVRAAVKKMRSADFILQARASGCGPWRLLRRHLAPNLMPVLLAQFWVSVPVFILAEATLGMLGLGVTEPLPSWGSILREIEGAGILSRPWVAAPAILLAAVVGSFHLVMPREDYSI